MPAKKNQSMKSKSTTSYKKGGSMKNQKVHPLKYFIDQNEKKIKEAQKGIETYDKYDTKMNPMDSTANAAFDKAKKVKENKKRRKEIYNEMTNSGWFDPITSEPSGTRKKKAKKK